MPGRRSRRRSTTLRTLTSARRAGGVWGLCCLSSACAHLYAAAPGPPRGLAGPAAVLGLCAPVAAASPGRPALARCPAKRAPTRPARRPARSPLQGRVHSEWFVGGTTNMCFNCLDRHVVGGRVVSSCLLAAAGWPAAAACGQAWRPRMRLACSGASRMFLPPRSAPGLHRARCSIPLLPLRATPPGGGPRRRAGVHL